MKKCPYCLTLMNDDAKTCPKCLKDVEHVSSMKSVAPKENQFSYYSVILGLIIAIGSVFASLSQGINKKNYQIEYNKIVEEYKAAPSEALRTKGEQIMALIKTCEFREIAFYVIGSIGLIIFLYALISWLIKKKKKNKKNAG